MSDQATVVQYEVEGAVARIVLNRAKALNAFDAALRRDLASALQRAATDTSVHAVVLTGAGRAFGAGADLKEGMKNGQDTRRMILEEYAPAINTIAEMPKPVIAAVEGFVAGIACAHVLVCDLVVMAEDARFILPFANIALVPDGGLTWLLERRIGHRLAFEFAADADGVSAARCHELGLANRVVPKGDAIATAMEWAGRLSLRSPLALGLTKQLLRESPALTLGQAQEREAAVQSKCIDSADFREGVAAFFAKRRPKFTGR